MRPAVFETRGWERETVAGLPPGMLRAREAALLRVLTRDGYEGLGDIVDAGAFLGASSYALASGLEQNARIPVEPRRLHAYDLFTLWCEQDRTEAFMAAEVERSFGVDLSGARSTLPLYLAALGPLARHVQVHAGDITAERWSGRPIELMFIDICKSPAIWAHLLESFYPSLIPGRSAVVHQDYHHPLLPWIHVVQERLSDWFELAAPKVDDSAAFLLRDPIPEAVLREVAAYAFEPADERRLMDRAIERLGGEARHLRLAKVILLKRQGRLSEARALLDRVRPDLPDPAVDPHYKPYGYFTEVELTRAEARESPPPDGFEEAAYLTANPDVAAGIAAGQFESALHHWLLLGRRHGAPLRP